LGRIDVHQGRIADLLILVSLLVCILNRTFYAGNETIQFCTIHLSLLVFVVPVILWQPRKMGETTPPLLLVWVVESPLAGQAILNDLAATRAAVDLVSNRPEHGRQLLGVS